MNSKSEKCNFIVAFGRIALAAAMFVAIIAVFIYLPPGGGIQYEKTRIPVKLVFLDIHYDKTCLGNPKVYTAATFQYNNTTKYDFILDGIRYELQIGHMYWLILDQHYHPMELLDYKTGRHIMYL